MKKVRLLDRVQAVLHFYIILILATIQESCLKRELAGNNCYHISLRSDTDVFEENVIVNPFHVEPTSSYELLLSI